MTNQSNLEQGTVALMEDLAEMLRAEVLPTHPPLILLIDKISKDPTLKQVDLYSKYTRLAALVGGDWVTVKEELRNATGFGIPAFYCSISAMLAVFTCRRSRSHDELVSSLTELYNHISAGNKILNKQVEHAITTMGKQEELVNNAAANITNVIEKQMEQANIAEASFTNFSDRVDNTIASMIKQEELVKKAEASITNIIEQAAHATTAMEKQVEQVKKVEESIANVTEAHKAINTNDKQTPLKASSSEQSVQFNVQAAVIPGTTFRCKYGTLTIDNQYKCTFNGSRLEAKKLALWFNLPVTLNDLTKILNLDHEKLIINTNFSLEQLNTINKSYDADKKKDLITRLFVIFKHKPGQWSCIC